MLLIMKLWGFTEHLLEGSWGCFTIQGTARFNVKGAAFTHRTQENLCPTVSRRLLTQEKSHGDAEEGDAGGLCAEQAAPSDQAGPDDGGRPLAQALADHGHEWGWKGKEGELSG